MDERPGEAQGAAPAAAPVARKPRGRGQKVKDKDAEDIAAYDRDEIEVVEPKKAPMEVPTRGAFFLHDDRTSDEPAKKYVPNHIPMNASVVRRSS